MNKRRQQRGVLTLHSLALCLFVPRASRVQEVDEAAESAGERNARFSQWLPSTSALPGMCVEYRMKLHHRKFDRLCTTLSKPKTNVAMLGRSSSTSPRGS